MLLLLIFEEILFYCVCKPKKLAPPRLKNGVTQIVLTVSGTITCISLE